MVIDKLFTPEEVAEVLKLSVITVKKWLRSGKLKGVKIGSRGDWRVKEIDLEKFIQDQNGK